MEIVLDLLKLDLGVTHTHRDTYFNALITRCEKEIRRKGILLDLTDTEDQMLLSDYAAWTYRKRQENIPMAQNLQLRIRNRIIKARSEINVQVIN